jgi:hypothetical protein
MKDDLSWEATREPPEGARSSRVLLNKTVDMENPLRRLLIDLDSPGI